MTKLTYDQAITLVNHEINKKSKEIEILKNCIQYLSNDSKSKDELTQSPEKILENFGVKIN